jgi:CDP-diacylglycerol---serine O-phosphatidyltransferase
MRDELQTTRSGGQQRPGRHRRAVRSRILRGTSVLPALFTLLNGLAGFGAIHFAAKEGLGSPLATGPTLWNLKVACGLIFVAMFCDMLDGRLARMTRTTTDFGAQLDSLCDIVSFGVAPAVIILRSSISILRAQDLEYLTVERAVWGVTALYVACAAIRLARFNVETDADESAHMDFRGLPSPGAAAALAGMVLLFVDLSESGWPWLDGEAVLLSMSVTLPILTLLCAGLMVSRFRYPHLVNQYIRGRRPVSYLIKLLVVLVAMLIEPYATFALVMAVYAMSGPVRSAWARLHVRGQR